MKTTIRGLFDLPDTKLSTQSSTASVDIVSPLRVAAAAGIGSTGEFEATLSRYPRGDTHKTDRVSETTNAR
jgi:hypothetical protein